jgi:hypothetical protein
MNLMWLRIQVEATMPSTTTMTMDEFKAAIHRDHKKWAFLTEFLGQHDHDRPTFGVTPNGTVLVNPSWADRIGVAEMIKLIRGELATANELRKHVRFME